MMRMPRTPRERIAAMRLPKLLAIALAAAALAPAVAAAAAPTVDGVFDLPNVPHHLALGPDGNVWIAVDGLTDNIARVRPDGTVDRFTSAAIVSPIGIVAGPDGQLWVTENGAVAHFSPSDPSAARRVDIPGLVANGIAAGPDGNLWTASGDSLYRIGPDERFTAFRPTGLQGGHGIAAGSDGNLYVVDFLGAQILAVTTAGVATQAYPTGVGPQEVVAGPAGQMGFTDPTNTPQQVGRFTPPDARSVRSTDLLTGTDPFGIVFAQDGAYWIANRNDVLTRMAPDGTVTTLRGFPRDSNPRYLTLGRDGTLWVGLETSRQVARVTGVVVPPPAGNGGGGGGGGGATGGDRTRPVVSHVVFPLLHVGRSAMLKLTLSEAATVRVRWERKLPGRRKADRCAAPRRAPHGRRCARFKAVGTQTRRAASGANRLSIAGRIGRRRIPAGFYRLTVVATDAAGNRSKPVTQLLAVNRRASRPTRRVATTR
jgi:virginiamycin B lyase